MLFQKCGDFEREINYCISLFRGCDELGDWLNLIFGKINLSFLIKNKKSEIKLTILIELHN